MARYENHVFAGRQRAAVVLSEHGPASSPSEAWVDDLLVVVGAARRL
jgi:hypothetical protein